MLTFDIQVYRIFLLGLRYALSWTWTIVALIYMVLQRIWKQFNFSNPIIVVALLSVHKSKINGSTFLTARYVWHWQNVSRSCSNGCVVTIQGYDLPSGTTRHHLGQGDRRWDKDWAFASHIRNAGVELNTRSRGRHRCFRSHAEVRGRPSDTKTRLAQSESTLQQINQRPSMWTKFLCWSFINSRLLSSIQILVFARYHCCTVS